MAYGEKVIDVTAEELENAVKGFGKKAYVLGVPGFYGADNVLIKTFDNMIADGDVMVADGVLKGANITNIRKQGKLIISEDITELATGIFSNESLLIGVKIPDTVTTIPPGAFSRCTSLTSVIIPDSVTSIGNAAFGNCKSLKSVNLGKGVTHISDGAFDNCISLTDVYYKGSKTKFDKIEIGMLNEYLKNATIHYEQIGSTAVDLTDYAKKEDVEGFGVQIDANQKSIESLKINKADKTYVDNKTAEVYDEIDNVVAEVTDVRTGADGTVYDSAGEALREQTNNLNNGLELLNESVFGDKKYISLPVVDETYKVFKDGTILTNGRSKSYIVSDYVGQTVKAKGWYGASLPLAVFFDVEGDFLSYANGDKAWSNTYQDITVPENAYKVYINDNDAKFEIDLQVFKRDTDYNVRDELERIESLIPDTSAYYDIEQAQLQLAKTQRMNDFVYSDFDKAYFVLTIDDANKFLPLVYNLCHELGVVVCPAVITSNLNTVYDTADGKTIKEICDLIVADGGEILSHSGKFIKADSTKQDYIDVFRTPKQTLENLGYTVRGIITAGGTNYLFNDIRLDNWSRKYYDYSDQNGLGTSKAYYKPRWWFHDLSMDNAKAYIDNAVANKSFVVMAMHGTDNTDDLEHIDHLRELLEYMIAKGTDKLKFVTWAYVNDNFGTTKLEKRIKALETK